MADVPEVLSSEPIELLAAGRRNLAVKDYPSAVTYLGKACELLAAAHGDHADECGEAYLWYGKALLGLSREESGVLGDGLPGNEGGDEDQDGDEDGDNANGDGSDDDDDEKAEDSNETKPDSSNAANLKNGQPEGDSGPTSGKESQPTSSTDAGQGETQPSGTEGDEDAEDAEEDDPENLQIAWEMLELARSILSKREKNVDEAKAYLAEAHLLLGEVALESETYDKAIIDMEKCLELQKELYKSDDRRIAESHYQIGLANSLASNFEEAVVHFKNAANILQARIATLERPSAPQDDATVKKFAAADPFYSVTGEIKELKELLPEIHEKIQDMMEYKQEAIRAVRAQLCPPTNGEGSSSSSFSPSVISSEFQSSSSSLQPKQASDISHLIRRKRKSSQNEETSTGDEPNPAKKPSL